MTKNRPTCRDVSIGGRGIDHGHQLVLSDRFVEI